LTEPPERYGLPAHADSPVQENVVPATVAAVAAGLLASAGTVVAFAVAARRGRRTRGGRTW
jgi:formate dehydrogenase iron-sulfur subunit